MRCHIYRSAVRDGLYVYVSAPSDDADAGRAAERRASDSEATSGGAASEHVDAALLASLPEPVRRQLGRAERAMTLTLDRSRPLGQENIDLVMENLRKQGFHIQMPRDIEPLVSAVADDSISSASARTADGSITPGD